MANCVSCGASNLGMARAPLVIVDGEWYCDDCLPKKKGRVKCQTCGKEAFSSGDLHFKTENGRYMCTECMEKAGIMKKYDYIMKSVAKTTAAPASSAGNDIAASLGGLRILLDQNLSPGETVTYAIQGNAGEALACSKSNVFILKSGMAVGSITGRRCSKFAWNQIKGVDLKLGNLYGLLEVKDGKLPENDANDITKAKKADNAITFLLSRKPEFDQALNSMQSYLHR